MTPKVLLTNDDGPPNPKYSPYVLGLYRYLKNHLGWDVKVVLPSAQQSWTGKAYRTKEVTKGSYFYPRNDGLGDISPASRPLKDGELAEWILLDGTPATCVNIALHNLYPGEIDLVISGPNLGRNTSAAFALSSGTVGAAMSASLSKIRSIAISYGTMVYPTPTEYFEPANDLGCRIINHLWHNWGSDYASLEGGGVDLYSVNIPLIEALLSDKSLQICWTRLWRNSYGRLFENAVDPSDSLATIPSNVATEVAKAHENGTMIEEPKLLFKWAPDMKALINPFFDTLPVGSDAWAIHKGWISVTPLRSTFAEPPCMGEADLEKIVWKMKL